MTVQLPKPQSPTDRLILPLDTPTVAEARAIVEETKGTIGVYKVGMQLQFAGGLAFAEDLAREGHKVFLDVKLLDIDNTVEKAVENIARMGMTFVTIHAYPKTMRAAVKGRGDAPMCLLGVTVLTSMDTEDMKAAGYSGDVTELVRARTVAARAAGMGGIVCSPQEVGQLRDLAGPDMVLVTPGIRPAGYPGDDQKRIMTPADAIRAGSDYLVMGRPITGAPDRRAAARAVVDEIEAALGGL